MKKLLLIIVCFWVYGEGRAQTKDTTAKVKSKRFYSGITIAPNYLIGKLYKDLENVYSGTNGTIRTDTKKQSIGVSLSYNSLIMFKWFFIGIGEGVDFLNYKSLYTDDFPDNVDHMTYYEYYNNKLLQISVPISFNLLLGKKKKMYTGLFYDINFIVYANQTILKQSYSYNAGANIYEQKVSYDFANRQSNRSYGIDFGYKLIDTKKVDLNLSLSFKQSNPISTLYYAQYPFSQYRNTIQYNTLLLNLQLVFK